jgi:HEAT repeat protein
MREWERRMAGWNTEQLTVVLREGSDTQRAAVVDLFAAHTSEVVGELLDSLAREQDDGVIYVLMKTLRALHQREGLFSKGLFSKWRTRVQDPNWPLLFGVDLDWINDLTTGTVSERWANEFNKRRLPLWEDSHTRLAEKGWLIRSSRLGEADKYYTVRRGKRWAAVSDPGMRPRVVALAEIIGPEAIPVLRELLVEKDEFLEIAVAKVLGKLKSPEAVEPLSQCLSLANNWDMVQTTVNALAETHSSQAIQPLIEALFSRRREIEPYAAEIVKAITALDGTTSLISAARTALDQDDESRRFIAAYSLHMCRDKGPETEALLIRASSDLEPEPRVRREAILGLAKTQSLKAEKCLLRACLEDPDGEVRKEAGKGLHWFPGDAGVPNLIAALGNRQEEIPIRAAEALGRVQDESAIPALVTTLEDHPDRTRIAAAEALEALGHDQPEVLLEVLCPIVRSALDLRSREEAARVLEKIPGGMDRLYQPIKDALIASHYEEVIKLVGSETPFLPNDANLYWWRAVAKLSLKRYGDALSDLDRTIVRCREAATRFHIEPPDCSDLVHRTRAEVLADLNRLPEALAAAEKAAEIEPEEADNHFLVGWLAYRTNELGKSVAAGRSTLELDPKRPMAEFNLGLALLASGQSPEDIDAYNRGIFLCAELDQETAMVNLDGASGDLDALILERPQLTAGAEEARTQLKRAREARLHPSQ